jgi:glucokinase
VILAGDLGGTKANLGLYTLRDGQLVEMVSRRFATADFPDLPSLVRAFPEARQAAPDRAVFGVPGPVLRGRSRPTNLSWELDARRLESELAIPEVTLVNDLVATSAGLLDLPEDKFECIFAGAPHERGTRAVLAPGTGLGQAFLVWDGNHYHPLPSEGGHADFAPRNDVEMRLLAYWLERLGRVSYEHLLAGPGVGRIYEFLRAEGRFGESPELARALAAAPDANAAIGEAGLEGRDSLATETVRLWASLLGAEAGNLALRALALGGIYLAGGIVAKLTPVLRGVTFRDAYLGKGRLGDFVAKIPVTVLLDDRAALRGAAHIALHADGL